MDNNPLHDRPLVHLAHWSFHCPKHLWNSSFGMFYCRRCVQHCLFPSLKARLFQWHLLVWIQPKVWRSHIWRLRRLSIFPQILDGMSVRSRCRDVDRNFIFSHFVLGGEIAKHNISVFNTTTTSHTHPI